ETIRELEQRLFELRHQRNRAAPASAAPALARPAAALARLDADVLIEYLRCDERLLAIRADRSGACQATWLGEIGPVLDLLDQIQLSFQNVVIRPAEQRAQQHERWLAECRPLLRRCYDQLIAPLGEFALESRLLIAPCDPLYLLPFAALWDGSHYL